MVETENNAQDKKPKVSKLAMVSPLVVVSGFFIGLALAGWLKSNRFLEGIGFWTFIVSLPVGLIAGIIADYRICKSKGLLTGRVFSISGTILAFVLIVYMMIPPCPPRRNLAYRMICHANLNSLGVATQIYARNYDNKYPTANKWCDLLVKYAEVTEEEFVCPSAGKGRCHYAINPNASAVTHPDMVVLFETEGGWNRFGGQEMLTLENHKGKGCNILFNDGRVEFVKKRLIGQLKWKVDGDSSNE
jgi:prepilin-type processing-associated H-X9-DG protein